MIYEELVDVMLECCLSLEVILKGKLENINTDDEEYINKYLDDYIEDINNSEEIKDLVADALESDWEIYDVKFDEIGISVLDDEDIFVDVNVRVTIRDYSLEDYSKKVENNIDKYVKFKSNDKNVILKTIYNVRAL